MQEYPSAKSDMKELYQIKKIMRSIWVRRWRGDSIYYMLTIELF